MFISGMQVFVHGCAVTPNTVLTAMAEHGLKTKLHDVELIHIHTEGPAVYTKPEYEGMFWPWNGYKCQNIT